MTLTVDKIPATITASFASQRVGREYKNISVVTDLVEHKITYLVDAQFATSGGGWRTINKSYLILETALAKYNSIEL